MLDMPLVPAAQYLRTSDESERFSIPHQESAIAQYARQHGFEIVQTYKDFGRSGLLLRERHGLQQLLQEVMSHHAPFQAILVYDISRWGRFQDPDESAHYEYVCKRQGVPVHYCAEQFENNSSLSDSIVKALKRTMAGEFSRELSVKVYEGKLRLANLGFHGGGQAPYGLRRLLISRDGDQRILKRGESKGIKTDRVILVPGARNEIRCVRKIFEMTVHQRKTPTEIAHDLNRQHWPNCDGKRWCYRNVYDILRNPEYAGCATWGRTASKLHSYLKRLPRSAWIIRPGAYPSIVDLDTFRQAQEIIEERRTYPSRHSDEQMLNGLKALLQREKKLSSAIINAAPGLLHLKAYRKRFGSLFAAYERVGYQPAWILRGAVARTSRLEILRDALLSEIKGIFPKMKILGCGHKRRSIEIDRSCQISVQFCRPVWTSAHQLRWKFTVRPEDRRNAILLCLLNRAYTEVTDVYVVSAVGSSVRRMKQFGKDDPWLLRGARLATLAGLHDAVMSTTHSSLSSTR